MNPFKHWGSLAALLVGAVTGCKRESPSAPSPPQTASAQSPSEAEWFADVTASTGLQFIHVTATNFFMADQVGSGVVVQDFDNDGSVDLYFVQNADPQSPRRNALWKQESRGKFRDVSTGSGADIAGRGMGAIAGDANNDGLADLVITEYGATRLLQNLGSLKFKEITAASGINNPKWAVPASWVDFDRDGWLDLVVGNYVDYDPTHICHDAQGRRDFCSPEAFPPTAARLYRNITKLPGAPPRFEDVTEKSELHKALGVALGIVCADFTGDGWPDIFFADDGRPNRLFVNRTDGTFSEEATLRGIALNAMGRTAANMGVCYADFDLDGLGDLFITHLTEEFHSLFRQDVRGMFRDSIGSSGLQSQAWRGTGFGAAAADFNNDGLPDIAIANGLVSRSTPGQKPVDPGLDAWWAPYAQKAQLFANSSRGNFEDLSPKNPTFCGEARVGRSLATLDLDQDGGIDLLLGAIAGPARLYRNSVPQRGHWAQFRLILPEHGGRDAQGAEVWLSADGRTHWAVLQSATSYLSHHEPHIHFGLGGANAYESVRVRWPDGSEERFPGGTSDLRRILRKGDGKK